ncbi:Replication protein A 70 kDa DNA-binding subunit B [Abeliophyllum distichum]|uniref:Replication protein A 70 kDa DNA-binding subunit B n=1 Tax=Abeliophyllum distichum TaxID=126358 RepID=A0ABD1SY85_9LAMI
MEDKYKLIPDVSPADTNWTAKVIVVEKSLGRTAQYSPTKYQNITLMDPEKNKVQATIYNTNIQAFEDQLVSSKTYLISNTAVKPTKQQYRSWMGDVQWTISGRTKVEEIQEDHTVLLSSTYDFIFFDRLEKYMDSKVDISIIGVALDIKPKRLIQTWFGTQSYIQDVVLINERFQIVLLTMWENFVNNECIFISNNLTRKLIVIGTHLKVSSFNGLSISTKTNSSFLFDPAFHQAMQLRYWVEQNVDKLDDMVLKKEYLARTPAKLSTPTRDKLTQINNIPGLLAVVITDVKENKILYSSSFSGTLFY